ncbi:DMT family transporter [Prochlorococcus sp. MIT 1307]|uniref:DMT family transporter n=1 Tax=Prochlorococcus sp. MIT 1307 TaxID=3096219 RepID=UPI002A7522D2|nr:DMT family transporter [Prochlorococcus sp. MIT 1307]
MTGIIAAISASFSWTIACFLWRSQTKYFSPTQINLIKTSLATLIFLPIIFSIDWLSDLKEIAVLFLSGVIGISLGDTFYIEALHRLGTRRTLTIEAFSPVIASLIGSLIIGDTLSNTALLGAFVVSFSLVLIANERLRKFDGFSPDYLLNQQGYIYAFLSVFCAVIAAIISRLVLKSSDLSPLQSTEIRLIGALTILVPIVRVDSLSFIKEVSIQSKSKLVLATLLGTNIGIFLQQVVFKTLPIGIGWTLLSISPVISLFFAKFEGDNINNISILSAFLALLGVVIVLL